MDEGKGYLGNIEIREGDFSNTRSVKYKYNGEEVSGFFPESSIKDERLEVRVVAINVNQNWAFVKPIGGYFFENDNGIQVRREDLK